MNPQVELNLTLILFLPWFAILSVLYWMFPRTPRDLARMVFDVVALVASVAVFVASVHWSVTNADPTYGRMWQQILATALGYAVFLAAMTVAFLVRASWLRTRRKH